LAYSC